MNLPPSPQADRSRELETVTQKLNQMNVSRSNGTSNTAQLPDPLGAVHAARSNSSGRSLATTAKPSPTVDTANLNSKGYAATQASSSAALRRTTTSGSTNSPAGFTSPITPGSNSPYNSLSAAALIGGGISGTDMHAKLLDFQNKRQSRSNSLSTQQPKIPGPVGSPGPLTLNPVPAPKTAPIISSDKIDSSSQSSISLGGPLAFTSAPSLKKASSLSQRRGMKFMDISGASPSDTTSSSSSASSVTGSPVTSIPEGSPQSPVVPMPQSGGASTGARQGQPPLTLGANLTRSGSGIRRGNRSGAIPNRLPDKQMSGRKGQFDNYKKYVDVSTGRLNFAGKASLHSKGIDFSSGTSFRISLDEFEPLGELGRGNYGTVTKVLHKASNVLMAMKEIRLELDEQKFTQIIMELEVLHKCNSPYIVDFYGAFFVEGAVYVCMEYMDGGSLDKIYNGGVAEGYLAYITKAAVEGLRQLKDELSIIHRDVKPTNILVSTSGKVKLCDFGVSGNLVASMARTNIGCQSYMAPERIRSVNPNQVMTYTVESDIWSLGLSILETALGSYPYPPETYENIFSQLSAIVDGSPPSLPEDQYSSEARDFVTQCLNKNARKRPSYSQLLEHPWIKMWEKKHVDLGEFVAQALLKRDLANRAEADGDIKRPALHTVRPTDLALQQ